MVFVEAPTSSPCPSWLPCCSARSPWPLCMAGRTSEKTLLRAWVNSPSRVMEPRTVVVSWTAAYGPPGKRVGKQERCGREGAHGRVQLGRIMDGVQEPE